MVGVTLPTARSTLNDVSQTARASGICCRHALTTLASNAIIISRFGSSFLKSGFSAIFFANTGTRRGLSLISRTKTLSSGMLATTSSMIGICSPANRWSFHEPASTVFNSARDDFLTSRVLSPVRFVSLSCTATIAPSAVR